MELLVLPVLHLLMDAKPVNLLLFAKHAALAITRTVMFVPVVLQRQPVV
jgi:hypothetical protein